MSRCARRTLAIFAFLLTSLTAAVASSAPALACSRAGYGSLEEALSNNSFPDGTAVVAGRYVERLPAPDRDSWVVVIEVDAVVKGQVNDRVVGLAGRPHPGIGCTSFADQPPGREGVFILYYDHDTHLVGVNAGASIEDREYWSVEDLDGLEASLLPYPGEDLRDARDAPALFGSSWLPETVARNLAWAALGAAVVLGLACLLVRRIIRGRRRSVSSFDRGGIDGTQAAT